MLQVAQTPEEQETAPIGKKHVNYMQRSYYE